MFVEGKIKKYNSERGFGFIALEGQADIFFHITDFPKAGGEPKVGELLKFLIVQVPNNPQSSSKKRMIVTVIGLMIIAVLAVLVLKKYQSYQQSQKLKAAQLIEEQKKIVIAQRQALGDLPEVKLSKKTEQALKAIPTPAVHHDQKRLEQQPLIAQTQFSCDGRTLCSQMRSRAEAEYFINNCSNTKMDGDNDGIPCENDSRW